MNEIGVIAMPDKVLTVRVPENVVDKLDQIIEKINDDVPEAGANVATVLRYAVQDYVNRDVAKRRKDTIFLEIPIEDLRYEEMHQVLDALMTLENVIEQNSTDTIDNERKRKFVRACDKATDLLFQKTGDIEFTKDQVQKAVEKESK
jgi:hypothetical protein